MGADGGTIPKRCELVKEKKKVEKVDKATKNATKWRNCQLTQTPLKKPVIACRLGRLYSKEAVIEAILTKTIGNFPVASHIKGIKDFKELKLTENKDYTSNDVKGDGYLDLNQTQYLCPVTAIPMNGNQNFLVNWKCGCVFSEKAIQEIKSNNCIVCGSSWDPNESVMLNPEDDLLEQYKAKLVAEKAEKKSKKVKAEVNEESESAIVDGVINAEKQEKVDSKIKMEKSEKDKLKKVEKRKADDSDIQSDPTKSDTYKKLFTTSKEAKAKPQSHWTTFNPLYF